MQYLGRDLCALVKICESAEVVDLSYVKQAFECEYRNFECVLQAAVDFGIINLENEMIVLECSLAEVSSRVAKTIVNDMKLKSSYALFLDKFCFDPIGQRFEARLSQGDMLKYQIERRLFCDIGLAILDKDSLVLIDPILISHLKRKLCSLDDLKKSLTNRESVGELGEEIVLARELRLADQYPSLDTQVQRVSEDWSSLGYDIISFCKKSARVGAFRKIYIEVKFTSTTPAQFYASANEIEAAKMLGSQYCLYLISCHSMPSSEHIVFNGEDFWLQIIDNPFHRLFCDLSDWERSVESYLFKKVDK